MPLYEVVLEIDGRSETRLTDHPYQQGETVEIMGRMWRVTEVDGVPPTRFVLLEQAEAVSPIES